MVIALADVLVLPSGNVAWFGYAKIAVGLLLVALAVRGWLGRPRADADSPALRLAGRIDSMTAGKAFGLALLLATLNPKNLALVLAGALGDGRRRPRFQVNRRSRWRSSRWSAASGSARRWCWRW